MVIQIVDEQLMLNASPYTLHTHARLMIERGKGFVGAAIHLGEKNRHPEVVLHLFCQGLQVFLKGLLLIRNHSKYYPKIKRKYGHDLAKLVKATLKEFQAKPLRANVSKQLHILNEFYSEHLLRYSSLHDLIGGLKQIEFDLVRKRFFAVMRLSKRRLGI